MILRFFLSLCFSCFIFPIECRNVPDDILYPNNLKNWFLTASASPRIFCQRLSPCLLALPLVFGKKFEEPPCQIPNFSSCLGIGELSVKECEELKLLFHYLFVERELGYTLLGDKPMSFCLAPTCSGTYPTKLLNVV